MRKMIMLNGPPRCGKDTIAEALDEYLNSVRGDEYQVYHEKFSAPLKAGVRAIYDLDPHIEKTKDESDERILGDSYRRAQIALFNHLSRTHDKTVLGKLFASRIAKRDGLFIVSDTGRFDEVFPSIKDFDADQCTLFRIHRDGTSFANDIRQYVTNTDIIGIKSFDVDNNGSIQTVMMSIIDKLTELWGAPAKWNQSQSKA
jgi:hypothetical protein